MALKGTVSTLEDVPEAVRDQYVEKDGVFVLEVEGFVPKTKVDEFRDTNIKLKEQLEKLSSVDPEKYQALLDAEKQRERTEAEKRGEYERLINETKEEYEARLKAKDELLRKREARLTELEVDAKIQAVFADAGADPDLVVPLLKAKGMVRAVDADGTIRAQVLDADGKPRLNANGDEMSLAELATTLKQDQKFARLFNAEHGGGSGGAPKGGGAASKSTGYPINGTRQEKMAYVDANPETWRDDLAKALAAKG